MKIIENIPIKTIPPPQPDRIRIILTTFDTHEMDHFALQTILRTFYSYDLYIFHFYFVIKIFI